MKKSVCIETIFTEIPFEERFKFVKEAGFEYIEYIKSSINTAKYLNCSNLVIHSNALGEGGLVVNDYRKVCSFDKFSTAYDILKALAPIAEEAQLYG